MKRPVDPRAGQLCTSCNRSRNHPSKPSTEMHCSSPTCPWWRCAGCHADNDSTGANTATRRDGTSKHANP